jgi:hypothetical protein
MTTVVVGDETEMTAAMIAAMTAEMTVETTVEAMTVEATTEAIAVDMGSSLVGCLHTARSSRGAWRELIPTSFPSFSVVCFVATVTDGMTETKTGATLCMHKLAVCHT